MRAPPASQDRAGALRAEPAAQSQAEPLIAGAGVGITGTRDGIRFAQRNTLSAYLGEFRENGVEWQHNGDCRGADEAAGEIWKALGGRIDLHPPSKDTLRAFLAADYERSPEPYDVRNRNIVNECTVLLALPRGPYEERRSGTWQTIRYARRQRKHLIIVWPGGNATVENEPARSWRYGGGTLESNIKGFDLLRGDRLRLAIMSLPEGDPLRQAIAQGTEAGTAETEGLGPKDDGPVRDSGCAQPTDLPSNTPEKG